MRSGVRLGVDVGSVRVGVALCDPAGLIATPVVTLRHGHGDISAIVDLAAEHKAIEVVVGLPRTLAGKEGAAAAAAVAYAERLAERLSRRPGTPVGQQDPRDGQPGCPEGQPGSPEGQQDTRDGQPGSPEGQQDTPVRLVDERLSTVGAQRDLRASGVDTRRGRKVIDQAAAVIILQAALDAERATGAAPGRLLDQRTDG